MTTSDTTTEVPTGDATAGTAPEAGSAESVLPGTGTGTGTTPTSPITLPDVGDVFELPDGTPTVPIEGTDNVLATLPDGTQLILDPLGTVLQIIPAPTPPGGGDGPDRDYDYDKDRDWDRDKPRWYYEKYFSYKYVYNADYDCYYDKDRGHYWYDDRTVGKVEATKVKTVPKGGVDTGN